LRYCQPASGVPYQMQCSERDAQIPAGSGQIRAAS
jgi:hypothetical protein